MARSAPASDRDSSPPTIRSRKQRLRPDTPNLQAVPVELVAVAGADDANAAAEVPEKVVAALAYADNAIHPGQQAGVLKRLERLGDGRTGATGAVGDRGIGREAKAA